METTASPAEVPTLSKCTPLISVKCCYGRFLILLGACGAETAKSCCVSAIIYDLLELTRRRGRAAHGGEGKK